MGRRTTGSNASTGDTWIQCLCGSETHTHTDTRGMQVKVSPCFISLGRPNLVETGQQQQQQQQQQYSFTHTHTTREKCWEKLIQNWHRIWYISSRRFCGVVVGRFGARSSNTKDWWWVVVLESNTKDWWWVVVLESGTCLHRRKRRRILERCCHVFVVGSNCRILVVLFCIPGRTWMMQSSSSSSTSCLRPRSRENDNRLYHGEQGIGVQLLLLLLQTEKSPTARRL